MGKMPPGLAKYMAAKKSGAAPKKASATKKKKGS